MPAEVIREVPGFEGLYKIDISTPEGRCWSIKRKKYLSNKPDKREGRMSWTLYKDGKAYHSQAAVWIARTYPKLICNEHFPGAEIDHINTDPLDNRPENLRWVDRKGQMNNELTRQHMSESHMEKLHSEETKKRISESLKGEKHYLYGQNHTEETKKKISESHKGKKCSEETKKKMSESQKGRKNHMYGKHHSEETKKRISESLKRRFVQPK